MIDFTDEEKAFYNPEGIQPPHERIGEINEAMTGATSNLALVLFGIERYGRVIHADMAAPPLHKDMALNLTDPINRQALRQALDALEAVQ